MVMYSKTKWFNARVVMIGLEQGISLPKGCINVDAGSSLDANLQGDCWADSESPCGPFPVHIKRMSLGILHGLGTNREGLGISRFDQFGHGFIISIRFSIVQVFVAFHRF